MKLVWRLILNGGCIIKGIETAESSKSELFQFQFEFLMLNKETGDAILLISASPVESSYFTE